MRSDAMRGAERSGDEEMEGCCVAGARRWPPLCFACKRARLGNSGRCSRVCTDDAMSASKATASTTSARSFMARAIQDAMRHRHTRGCEAEKRKKAGVVDLHE